MSQDLELALRIRADLKSAQQALKKLDGHVRDLGKGGKTAQKDLGGFNKALDQSERKAAKLGDTARNVRRVLVGLGAVKLFQAAVRNTIRQEQAMRQVEQAIISTGGAAGYTAEELGRMASGLQEVTTFGDEAILEVQAKLLAFTSITRDQFARTTEVILDFATRTGRDAATSVTTLGVAINNPLTGMARLRQAGVDLSDSQQTMIRSMAESGDLMGAQNALLDALETAYGGAARTARDTFGGALSALGDAFGDLLEGPGSMSNAQDALELLTSGISVLKKSTDELADDPGMVDWGETMADIFAFVADSARSAGMTIGTAFEFTGQTLGAGAAQLMQLLQGNFRAAQTIGDEWVSDQEARLARIQGFNTRAAREELARIRAAREARAAERAAQKGKGGAGPTTTTPGTDDQDTAAADKSRAAIERLNQSLRDQIGMFGLTDAAALEYRLTLGDLSGDVATLGADGQALADSIVAQARQLEQMTEAVEAAKAAEAERQKLMDEGRSLTDSLRTAQEEYNATVARYQTLLAAGAISQETFNRGVAAAADALAEAEGQAKATNEEMDQYAVQAARNIQSSFADFLFDPFNDGLDGMLTGFIDVLRRMTAEALAAQLAKSLFGDIGGGELGGSIGGLLAGIFHTGGVVGAGGTTRQVSPLAFLGAPRYHNGGLAGDEVPAILQRGEEVLTRDDPRHQDNGGGQQGVRIVNVIDPAMTRDYLTSSDGERTILNVLAANQGAVRQILA